jgi:hypothetical protein
MVEKRHFSVFALIWKDGHENSVSVHQRKAFTSHLWTTHSNFEYGLLLSILITDSHTLNVMNAEPFALHNVGKVGFVL